jgi:homoserine/homoserine lactone efflux protein
MAIHLYLAYVATCVVVVIVPGPVVTLVIANSLRHGTRAGLLNIAGTQLGCACLVAIALVGLTSLIEILGGWFDWIRLAGAAYLVWLGVKLLRSPGSLVTVQRALEPRGGFLLQGFLVAMSNPKLLLLFGALFPQFIDPNGDYVEQVLLMGITLMTIAACFDSTYAVLSGRAAALLSERRVRLVSWASGLCLVGGGVCLAFARAK